jgi:transposase-like protein
MDKRLRFNSEQFKGFKHNLQEALRGDLHLATRRWWKEILRTTNAIERSFVEVRLRTRPMVTFVNMASVDRIIFAIFTAYNQKWGKCTPPAPN